MDKKAFLDTTILADILLKRGTLQTTALTALKRFTIIEYPMYAIKEFKAGVLYNWVWLHNKLASTGSHAATLKAVQAAIGFRRMLPATAIEALSDLANQDKATFGELADRFGREADPDRVTADRRRLAARRRITLAWLKRKSLGQVVNELSCYPEQAPREVADGLLDCKPVKCPAAVACSMAQELRAKPELLVKLRQAVTAAEQKPENQKRAKALKQAIQGREITEASCRSLGDAIFAFFAPTDAVILTTNDRDHRPLAAALGKTVEIP